MGGRTVDGRHVQRVRARADEPVWEALRKPAGRIWLAGEHTDTMTGYMEGAIRSGKRVAVEIGKRA